MSPCLQFYAFLPSSQSNLTDSYSRELSDKDSMLSIVSWQRVEQRFGPHTLDLMSLDSSVKLIVRGVHFNALRSFLLQSPAGSNHLPRPLASPRTLVFPPFTLAGPVWNFSLKSHVNFSIVVPILFPLPFWCPVLSPHSQEHLIYLQEGRLWYPSFPFSKGNFMACPLQWDLLVFRVYRIV